LKYYPADIQENPNGQNKLQEEQAMMLHITKYPARQFPVGNLFNFERDIDSLFQDFLGDSWFGGRPAGAPAVNFSETAGESIITMELPGVKKEDLKIVVEDSQITVSGERKQASLPENSRWVRNEIGAGKFSRTFELPHEVKADGISAELADGILRIVLPKAEAVRPREITVR
jgi:HSP20 family protein